MFSVARLRLFIFGLFAYALINASFVQAREESLFTSSVSYCAPPESLLIQQFDIAYIKSNNSVNFNVSIASVLPNVNVSANLFVNVYGMRPLNLTLDLCSLLHGALCPLPTYNFTGADSITLPPSVPISSLVPGIAYKIPDLEAFAQLTLTEVGTGKVRACVQATVSNGWSVRQRSVEWATGGIALLALVSAIIYSYDPKSLAPVRFMDLIYLFQTIAASGLLALNYPIVYRSFALNFSWALGLFPVSESSPFQHSIDNMRRRTGGHVVADEAGGDVVSLVNRRLSPYNNNFVIPSSLLSKAAALKSVDIKSFLSGNLLETTEPELPTTVAGVVENANVFVGGQVATVTQGSSNVLETGIPIYVSTLGIPPENAFVAVFLVSLILVACLLAFLILVYVPLLIAPRTSWGRARAEEIERMRAAYPGWAKAWLLRGSLVIILPGFIFAFWQWRLKDSWLSILLAVIMVIALLAAVLPPLYITLRPTLSSRLPMLGGGSDETTTHALAPLTVPFRSERYWCMAPLLLALLTKSLVLALASSVPLFQAVFLLVLDIILLISLFIFKPHPTRRADALSIFLSLVRVICGGLLIAFVESFAVKAIPRVVIGIISAVIFSVTVVIMLINVLVNIGLWRAVRWVVCSGRRERGATALSSRGGSDTSVDREKGLEDKHLSPISVTPAPSSTHHFYDRPGHPTPTSTLSAFTPVSAYYPISPHSMHSGGTTTTAESTLGEPLPRRWSFQHSRPPSASVTSPSISHYSQHSYGLDGAPITPSESMYTTPRHSLVPPSPSREGDSGHSQQATSDGRH